MGGDLGCGGAALMAAESAARAGAGLVSVATRAQHIPAFLARCPELMVNGLEEPAELKFLLQKATVIVIGPGLGQSDWSKQVFQQALQVQAADEKTNGCGCRWFELACGI